MAGYRAGYDDENEDVWGEGPDEEEEGVPLWQDSCHYLKFNQLGR